MLINNQEGCFARIMSIILSLVTIAVLSIMLRSHSVVSSRPQGREKKPTTAVEKKFRHEQWTLP